jgi:hypothetical protein
MAWIPPDSGIEGVRSNKHCACSGSGEQERATEWGKPPLGVSVTDRICRSPLGIVSAVDETSREKL